MQMSPDPCAPGVQSGMIPPDLAQLVTAWPDLPDHIKQTIKTLLDPFLQGSAQLNTLNRKSEGDGDE
ncbi:hypothetical protein ACFL3F_02225 [Planctomycetota bacterium]